MSDYISKFYECSDQGCEILRLAYFSDEKDHVYLSMFEQLKCQSSIITKLKHIWHIIKYGTPYIDNFILTRESAKKMIVDLQDFVKDV